MKFQELQLNWEGFGKKDPLWSILTNPRYKNNKWKSQDFFNTGVLEMNKIFSYLKKNNIFYVNKMALDFGCGVGRLTQAMSSRFDRVYGVDIAYSMIKLAKQYNNKKNCIFIQNNKPDLSCFGNKKFNFIYSSLTLQHMRPFYSKKYIKEFLRILDKKGILLFQLTEKRVAIEPKEKLRLFIKKFTPYILQTYLKKIRNNNMPVMELYGVPKKDVIKIVQSNQGKIVDIQENSRAGDTWKSNLYMIEKY